MEKPSDVEPYWDLLTIKAMFTEWLALNMNLLVVLNQSRGGLGMFLLKSRWPERPLAVEISLNPGEKKTFFWDE